MAETLDDKHEKTDTEVLFEVLLNYSVKFGFTVKRGEHLNPEDEVSTVILSLKNKTLEII